MKQLLREEALAAFEAGLSFTRQSGIAERAEELRRRTIDIYQRAADHAREHDRVVGAESAQRGGAGRVQHLQQQVDLDWPLGALRRSLGGRLRGRSDLGLLQRADSAVWRRIHQRGVKAQGRSPQASPAHRRFFRPALPGQEPPLHRVYPVYQLRALRDLQHQSRCYGLSASRRVPPVVPTSRSEQLIKCGARLAAERKVDRHGSVRYLRFPRGVKLSKRMSSQ